MHYLLLTLLLLPLTSSAQIEGRFCRPSVGHFGDGIHIKFSKDGTYVYDGGGCMENGGYGCYTLANDSIRLECYHSTFMEPIARLKHAKVKLECGHEWYRINEGADDGNIVQMWGAPRWRYNLYYMKDSIRVISSRGAWYLHHEKYFNIKVRIASPTN